MSVSRRTAWASVVSGLALFAGCASAGSTGAPPTASTAEPPKTTPTAPTKPSSDGDSSQLVAMVTANVATTDLSALVKITSAKAVGENGGPPGKSGYVNHVYVADVVTCLYGCGAAKTVSFSEMAEAEVTPHAVGTSMVVSACSSSAGGYFTPDVGYLIPASELPASALSALAAKPPPRGDSACKR